METTMSYEQACEWVHGHTDGDNLDRHELDAAYAAMVGFGTYDSHDEKSASFLWSQCVTEADSGR